MKTLSYYKQLRESYACIIPKTAPAWELIEALDALIASLRPESYFRGVPVKLPRGWAISCNTSSDTIVITDHRGVGRGKVYPKLNGEYAVWWDGEYKTTFGTQQETIQWLNDKVNHDTTR